MAEGEDEKVNGPRIAAQILKSMNLSAKDRIVKTIEARSPRLAQKINENLFNFDDINELTPQGVQTLIKEIDHDDLVMSFKLATSEVKAILIQNMSERKRAMVESDLESMPPVKKLEVEDAQRRILVKLDELRTQGVIRTQSPNEIWI